MSSFINLDDSSFDQEVLNSPVPVLVEFGAEWCGPCRQLEPILEQMAAEWDKKVRLAKVDVDQSVNTAMKFQVMSLPTLILFVDGQACERLSGKQPRDRMVEKFSPFITK
ncbi:MAG: thioredoxin [Chloroflexi bacterium]|nr:thioredoxin [Chloroflexota bacterium]